VTFRKRSNPEAALGQTRSPDPLPGLIASIEQTVENFRQADLPRWKYRQIVRDQKEAADAALAEATGVEEPAYSFGGPPPV
jgi:hypothetical protein